MSVTSGTLQSVLTRMGGDVDQWRETLTVDQLAGARIRWRRPKKDIERNVVSVLVDRIGFCVAQIESGERPDFRLEIQTANGPLGAGCEVTLFHNASADELASTGSMETRLWNQWTRFAKRLRDALDEHDELSRIYGALHFRRLGHDVLDEVDRDALIKDVVRLLTISPPMAVLADFDETLYPELSRHVQQIWTCRVLGAEAFLWWCAHLQTGILRNPGIVLRERVVAKASSAATFDWKNVARGARWLAIGALGQAVDDHAPFYDGRTYSSINGGCLFDRVFFVDIGSFGVLQLEPEVIWAATPDEIEELRNQVIEDLQR